MIASTPIPASDAGLVSALLAANLPIDDVGDPGRFFFRVARHGQLLGHGGFELYGDDALLRSIVVPAEIRATGTGRIVTEAVLREIAQVGARQVFLLTTGASAFFEHLGFVVTDRASAPPSILATRQASSICATAAMLSRAL